MRVSEVFSVTMKRVLVLLVAAIMAITLSFGMSASPADAAGFHHHGCQKHSQGFKSSHGKCFHKKHNNGFHKKNHHRWDHNWMK